MKYSLLMTILFLTTLTSCLYQMPTDDHLCTSPHTNNPHITHEKPASLIPTQ